MLDNIKVLLGDAAAAYTNAQIELCLQMAEADIAAICGRKDLDAELQLLAARMAVVRLNRLNTEGLAGQAYSGVNETYIDGYPADIMQVLQRKRRVKML